MHWIVNRIREKAKANPKRIAFPECKDERVQEAVRIIKEENIAEPLVLSPQTLEKEKQEEFANQYYQRHSQRHESFEEVRQLMQDPLYYGAMMTKLGFADGFVAGAVYSTSKVARAAIRCLDSDPQINLASGCFVMAFEHSSYGERGVLIFSDCAVIPFPNPEQLALIALAAAQFTRDVLEFEPRVAFLSFSTKGSAKGRWIEKIREAVEITRARDASFLVDGELQADAALDADVASRKLPFSPVAGKANVLIFPSLEAGNISYKLVQRLAKARALGPIILGFTQPCSDLSRGCSVDDIIDCAALTTIRAQNKIKNKK
ncbi:MAG: phosphate acetyltransferase [Candidatus Omnitrophica bacterium]|nr:phosphate acetyltransferase [Candidatus Omnitrophota bacterium]